MPGTSVRQARRRRKRLLLLLLFLLPIPSITTTALTVSVFGETTSVNPRAFAMGTVDLAAGTGDAPLKLEKMMPGDSVTASLRLANSGTVPLRYSMTSAATDPDGRALGEAIRVTVRTEGSGCDAFDGEVVLEAGRLAGANFGNALVGHQDGDRSLEGVSSEILCFRATLPASVDDRYAGGATTATFTFDAERMEEGR